MTYKYNPKLKDSGIISCIPQSEPCPLKCEDCFFLGGRSYLEPLSENLPNMPTLEQVGHRVVRVNDGGDSSLGGEVRYDTGKYPLRFYNTSLDSFPMESFVEPVVLTINPGQMTDLGFYKLDPIPPNLMFVRFRANIWNLNLATRAVSYYSMREVPIVMTFMAYFHTSISPIHKHFYEWRKRTTNPYWAITREGWAKIMYRFISHPLYNKWVYSCGTEGKDGTSLCRFCGNCLREFYATKERMAKCDNESAEKTADQEINVLLR